MALTQIKSGAIADDAIDSSALWTTEVVADYESHQDSQTVNGL